MGDYGEKNMKTQQDRKQEQPRAEQPVTGEENTVLHTPAGEMPDANEKQGLKKEDIETEIKDQVQKINKAA